MSMRHNTTGTYEGTADLVEILIAESKFAYGWRPVRAAILYALRDMRPDDSDDDTVYLTPEQFQTWLAEAKALAKARGDGLKPADVLGLTAFQIRAMPVASGARPSPWPVLTTPPACRSPSLPATPPPSMRGSGRASAGSTASSSGWGCRRRRSAIGSAATRSAAKSGSLASPRPT